MQSLSNLGFSSYRFKENPEELRFAEAWNHQCTVYATLGYMLGDGRTPKDPTDHEKRLVATVMQWLGSPVGQSFLKELGYERKALS